MKNKKEKKKEFKHHILYDKVEGYDLEDLFVNLDTLKFEYKQKFEIINFQITLGRAYAFIKYKTDADSGEL